MTHIDYLLWDVRESAIISRFMEGKHW